MKHQVFLWFLAATFSWLASKQCVVQCICDVRLFISGDENVMKIEFAHNKYAYVDVNLNSPSPAHFFIVNGDIIKYYLRHEQFLRTEYIERFALSPESTALLDQFLQYDSFFRGLMPAASYVEETFSLDRRYGRHLQVDRLPDLSFQLIDPRTSFKLVINGRHHSIFHAFNVPGTTFIVRLSNQNKFTVNSHTINYLLPHEIARLARQSRNREQAWRGQEWQPAQEMVVPLAPPASPELPSAVPMHPLHPLPMNLMNFQPRASFSQRPPPIGPTQRGQSSSQPDDSANRNQGWRPFDPNSWTPFH